MRGHAAATVHDEHVGRIACVAVDESGYTMAADSAACHRHSHHRRFLSETDARRSDSIRFLFLVPDWRFLGGGACPASSAFHRLLHTANDGEHGRVQL